jgi:hypothetical protein
MGRTQFEGGEDGLEIQRLDANILNEQSWTDHRGWPSSFGVGRRANNPHRKTSNLLRTQPRTRMDSLARLKHRKLKMRLGTSNVRNIRRTGAMKTRARELGNYK